MEKCRAYDVFFTEATMPLLIRRAVAADVPILVEFNRRLALETEHKALDLTVLTAGVTAGFADEAKARYFVAQEEGQVVGQLMLTQEWSDWRNGWLWWIQSVYVPPDCRRKGVFRALYQHVYQAANTDPQVVGIRLYMEQDNHVAQQTYLSLGMKLPGYVVLERYPL
jgi:ribosomal protein S18 acetylase RimI-like enzyme